MMDSLTRSAPILVYVVGLASVLAGAWAVYGQFCGQAKKPRPTHAWGIAVFALLTLVVGGVVTLREGEARDLEMRADLLRHTEDISVMIRAEDVRKLSFSARDSTNAAFQCLHAQLRAYARAVGHRSLYTQALREGRTVFGPESLSETDPMASPPGTPCRPPTAANRELFRNGAALTEGPVGGEQGVFVSAFAPVKDVRTGEVLMAVGMDLDRNEWCQAIARARLPAVLLTWLVLLALVAGGEVLHWQGRRAEPHGSTSPWVEAAVAAGIGLAITLAAACWAHTTEGRLFRESFAHLAEARGKILVDSLANVRDFRLEGLAGFLQASPAVSRRQFQQYVAPLTGDGFAQAWEWIPAVPAAARAQFEADARRDGLADFALYEKDALGHRVPAASRACYYPVFYVEPAAGNERALGYDLGSETVRQTALEEAIRAETATTTDPITLVQETGTQKGALVCRPVFTETVPRRLRGFALLVVRLETMLEAALEKTGHDRTAVLVDLLQLFPDKEPLIIASSRPPANRPPAVVRQRLQTGPAAGRASSPFFAFGKAYALAMTPGPAFLSAYPRRSAWLVLLVGMVTTIGGAALVGLLSNNRNYLKAQIRARTARLNQSETRLRTITDSAQDAILMMNPDGGISYWNPAAERIFGYTSAEALGQNLHAFLVPPRYHAVHQASLAEFWQNGQGPAVGKTTDLEGRRKDGREISLQLSLSAVQLEGRWHGVGILRDITERKRAEEEIRRQAALISSLLDSIPDIVFFKNTEGGYLGCNPAFVEFVGRPRNEIIGRPDHDLFDKEIADAFREQDQRMLAVREPRHNEEWIAYPDGRRLLIDTLKTPYWGPDGELIGVLGISRDITAQKQAAEHLRQTNQSLEMANARANALVEQADAANCAKSEFLANMSHEIRTPMNGVMGMTELLRKTKLDGRQTEFAEAIAQSAQALLQVIDDVLDLAKVEAGKITITAEEFSVRSVLDGVLEVAGHREPEKGLSLAGILHHDVPDRVKGDPQRLRQVLLNLAGNAIKFTKEGEVTVRVRAVPGSGDRGVLRFEVQDTGIGMTAKQVKGLFQRFVQAEETTFRRFGGTGLGLAISYRLVELMGGRIGVQSEFGQGSTFWCELPFGPADQPAIGGNHPALARAQVVLGIQHAGLAESLREQFRSWGVGCAAAGTARELVAEVESAMSRKRATVVVCEDEFFVAGGASLRQELSRLGQEVSCLLLASPANALAQEAEALNPFRRVLLKPVKHSHLFDAFVIAVEGKDWQVVTSRVEPDAGAADDGRVSRLRILLAEDHPINRKLSLLVLEGLGAAADTAENGLQVMAAVVRQDYDVILMDCNMPEMDGYEATQKIRQLEESRGTRREKRTRIVALTANALAKDRERCLAGGMDGFLSKPFTAAELRRALFRCVGTEGATPVAAATGSRLDQLAAELDRESVALMIEDYIKDLPVRQATLERDLAEGKREEVERTAHSLKGVSAQFGLEELSARFGAIEEAAETGDLARARDQVKILGATARTAATTLRQWLGKS